MGVLDDRMLVRRYQGAPVPAVTFSKHVLNMCHLINFQEQKYEDGRAHDGRMRECGPAKAGFRFLYMEI
jgi:hypothetical protein